ncbi:MAG: alkaline phosphatase D family protein [Gemmatimonadaceae bacterium]|jgi:alkaline phosphatase D|nr:alkaline phosphatase D family protein [Gemmatimonadaceae bacterium]
MSDPLLPRRDFLGGALAAGALGVLGRVRAWTPVDGAPAIITSDRARPVLEGGVQVGDPLRDRAILWSRSDRPSRVQVEWSTTERFADVRRVLGEPTRAVSAFTSHLDLRGLPAGETIFYRLRHECLDAPGALSEPIVGSFRTAPRRATRPVRVAWSGDMVGQGWGIDEARGGIRMYDALHRAEPDVFVHSGDNIYADQPLAREVTLDDGTVWRNLVTEAKSHPAQTLDDYRGNFAYNLLDANVRRCNAHVPVIAQWDDHEVVDNWFHDLVLSNDPRYTEPRVRVLAERAKQALFEFLPIRRHPVEAGRVYRSFSYGPLLELFVIDLRSYRSANSPNLQPERSPATAILGDAQLAWLERGLRASRATWKVVASDMPIGLVVPDRVRDGQRNYEAIANGENGAPLGREHEIAALLASMQRHRVRNVVWITADVHYAAAHHYSPERAAFTRFDPFWEFVAGPMHAGTFGPNALDATFGPDVRFASPAPKPNRPPSDNLQFYGTLDVDPRTRALTASLWNVVGTRLWSQELAAAR